MVAERRPIDVVSEAFELDDAEFGSLFGVDAATVRRWRSEGMPVTGIDKLEALRELADLLDGKLKRGRLPRAVRQRADAYGGQTMLELVAAGRHRELLDLTRGSFDISSAA